MAGIVVRSVVKSFGNVEALKGLDLTIEKGEFVVLLGPSGSGKTTLLRCVAGLETPDTGEVILGERCVFSAEQGIEVLPKDRGVGLVFQNYALYPHMSVFRNVAFGLRVRRVSDDEVRRRVGEVLKLVDLEGFEDRTPRQLSGGQQQRVAVARMIVSRPSTLLFDEPLSNLDPLLRVSVRSQLAELHRKLGATALYVTHDNSEAMTLGDRIAVIVKGEIAQIGSGRQIYNFPATVGVAEITGEVRTNLLRGEVHAAEARTLYLPESDPYCFIPLDAGFRDLAGRRVVIHVRPEDLGIVPQPSSEEGQVHVLAVAQQGAYAMAHLRIGERQEQMIARGLGAELLALRPGETVALRLRRGNVYDEQSGRIIRSFGYDEGDAARGYEETDARIADHFSAPLLT